MATGSYSLVRYSDNVSDQRINLGVIVWHPVDGFRVRFSSALDRVQAIDPRLLITPLRSQIEAIKAELAAPSNGNGAPSATGNEMLHHLSRLYKEGLEVVSPYPARIHSADDMLEHLYQMLVSPVPEIRRASTQQQFENRLKSAVRATASARRVKWEDLGVRKFGPLSVNVGVRTVSDTKRALWRALSLQSQDHPERQLAFAKATAMDIGVVRGSGQYKDYKQFVTLQPPKPQASERLKESLAWLDREADSVFVVDDAETLPRVIEKAVG